MLAYHRKWRLLDKTAERQAKECNHGYNNGPITGLPITGTRCIECLANEAVEQLKYSEWIPISDSPKVGGTYVIGGWRENEPYFFDWGFGSYIILSDRSEWTGEPGKKFRIQFWHALPPMPSRTIGDKNETTD